MGRWFDALTGALALVVFASACSADGSGPHGTIGTAPAACVPSCAEGACGDDGCGGSCGECAPGAEAPDAGCVPACSAAACETADGCGGTCGACPAAESCAECVLRLSVVDEVVAEGALQEVILALDFEPEEAAALPGIADLRFAVSGPAEVLSVGAGPPVTDADKEVFRDPATGEPYRVLPPAPGEAGSVVQVLILSPASSEPISAGRLLLLRMRILQEDAATAPGTSPVTVRVVEREQTFAPAAADAGLWGGGYGGAVVVWPEVDNE